MLRSILYLLLLVWPVVANLSADHLRSVCAADKGFCYEKAVNGECFGSSIKAQVLNRNCPCSCSEALHNRIQGCCKTVGQPEMKFCLPLCGYNTTVEDVRLQFT